MFTAIDPIIAPIIVITSKPGTTYPTSQNKTAFNTNPKIPKVTIFIGIVKIDKTGFTAKLINHKINAAKTAASQVDVTMPTKKYGSTKTAAAKSIIFNSEWIANCIILSK